MCFIRPTVYGAKLLAKLEPLDKNWSSQSQRSTGAAAVEEPRLQQQSLLGWG